MTEVSARTAAQAMPVHVGTLPLTHILSIPKADGIECHFQCSRLSTVRWLVRHHTACPVGRLSRPPTGEPFAGTALHHVFPAGTSPSCQSASRGLPFPPSELPDTLVCTLSVPLHAGHSAQHVVLCILFRVVPLLL